MNFIVAEHAKGNQFVVGFLVQADLVLVGTPLEFSYTHICYRTGSTLVFLALFT